MGEHRKSRERSVLSDDLDTNSVGNDLSFLLESVVVSLDEMSESVLSGDKDLLSAGELELGSSEGLLGVSDVLGGASDGKENLSDSDSCGFAESLTEGSSHTLLKSISSSAGEHLVNSDNVPRVDSDSHMEVVSSDLGLHVLVASNSSSFEGFGGDLFFLVANQMDAAGELVVSCSLLSDIVDSQLGVGDSSVESRLRVGLVLLVPVAPCGSSSHFK